MDAEYFRKELHKMELQAREYINDIKGHTPQDGQDKSEMIAQATIAMRHIEDARMRYGKVIQYSNGGESIYNK